MPRVYDLAVSGCPNGSLCRIRASDGRCAYCWRGPFEQAPEPEPDPGGGWIRDSARQAAQRTIDELAQDAPSSAELDELADELDEAGRLLDLERPPSEGERQRAREAIERATSSAEPDASSSADPKRKRKRKR